MTAVLVSHDGARWLPEALAAVQAQTRPPDRLVAADTDSADESPRLLAAALGDTAVVGLPRTTPYGSAVQAALNSLAVPPVDAASVAVEASADEGEATTDHGIARAVTEWIWLLHDDSAPRPDALDQLLARAAHSPSVWMIGPKVRGWDGARLLEAGRTINPGGHIDTEVDGFEIDQGQRDDVDEVLAVSSAGALVRRDVWDRLGGLDPAWCGYGDDVDLGWRINAAGGRVVVATRAVIRHVRAQSVGRRPSASVRGSAVVARRRSGMQVVLSNVAAVWVPLLVVRYVVGGLLRAVGLLVVSRRPGHALAELRAVAGVIRRPGMVRSRRRDRSQYREVAQRDLRHLFPSLGRRWRFSPFRVGWFGSERVQRQTAATAVETGPVAEETESLTTGDSALGRFARRPGSLLFLAMTVIALIAERHVLGSALHGGRLLPAPGGSSDLWSMYVASFHATSVGSFTPAPPSLAVLALLSTLAFGKAWLVVDVIILGAVPLSALSAFVAAGAVTAAVRVRVWVAVVYSLLPAVTGAIAGGRIDVAIIAILLPQLIRACAAAMDAASVASAVRRSVGAGLLLAVLVGFAPILWLIAVPALVLGVGFMELDAASRAIVRRLGSVVIVLVVPIVALVPWSWHLLAHPRLIVLTSGLPEFYTSQDPPSGLALLLLRAGGVAQPPVWVGAAIVLGALIGLNRRSRVAAARTGVALLVIGVALAVALTRQAGVTTGLPASRHWPGLALLVAGAGALLAALVAAVGARPALRNQAFGWRQPAAVVVIALAVVSTGTLAVAWVVRGAGTPLTSHNPAVLPLFTQSELSVATSPRALVIDDTAPTVTYALIRRPNGAQLGDADTAPQGPPGAAARGLAAAVRDLVAGRPGAANELQQYDIGYVVASISATRQLGPVLGRAATLTVVPAPGATVWRSSLPTGELTLLSAPAAVGATRAGATTARVAKALPATPGSADVTLPPGAAGRVVVLAEPVNSGWHASVDGHPLAGHTAYGWAQAFTVPSAGGRLHVGYGSHSRDAWLLAELVIVLVLIGVMLPGRTDDEMDGDL